MVIKLFISVWDNEKLVNGMEYGARQTGMMCDQLYKTSLKSPPGAL